MKDLEALGMGIYAIDSGYLRPRMDALHLIVEGGRAALVESGTAHSVPRVLAALAALGLAPEAVDWLLLTHVHLDHAGGAGALMQVLPNARLVVHPRGARHMIEPSKLWAGTVAVYGEAFAREAYGELVPVPAGRVLEATDGLLIELAGRRVEVIDAPGHARHHVCYFDTCTQGWFSGDAFGLSYRETDRAGRAFIFPATTPVQFEPAAMHATIARMLARKPACMYLTHYSRVTDLTRLAADLQRLLDAFVEIAEAAANVAEDMQRALIRAALESLLRREASEQGWALQGNEAVALYATDLELNAQGLQVWLKNRA
ncbi:MBL fold metallo-hydrolase [Uliginosibacterium sp. 31-12]|uniref:MBL fold metallo-hydrolase n=1 Tax=Uliginosibacterium sp. 31-12 TaxID=3062781 RepID=UPI0026E447DA|nr:MBL fold metallo-hydrolase [Uliginosibacterium sp. 31-12]MDO6387589.1 MBL fold metallo-hydrolase [Uliginosibacterium sp. 31-12]